jgi:hypothetical protein
MKIRQFLDVVPKPVKTAGFAIVACGVVIGITAVLIGSMHDGRFSPHAASGSVLTALIAHGLGLGLLGGVVTATWALCLGYVYADARRRAMPPILWTLVAAFIPNLLGFLLYFACRRPIALPCPHCGRAITAEQRFCSWCGQQGSSTLAIQTS